MTITGHTLHSRGDSGSYDSTGKISYDAVYHVFSSSALDSVPQVVSYVLSNIAAMGDSYSYGNGSEATAVLRRVSPKRVQGRPWQWVATLNYATPESSDDEQQSNPSGAPGEEGQNTTNPLDWRDTLVKSSKFITVPCYKVKYLTEASIFFAVGEYGPAMNTAGSAFVPPPEREVEIETFRIEHYDEYFPVDTKFYIGRVNADTFFINYDYMGSPAYERSFQQYECKLAQWDGAFERVNGYDVWRWTLEIQSHPDTWVDEVPNLGIYASARDGDPDGEGDFYSSGGSNPAPESGLRHIVDANDNPITTPVPLDLQGQPTEPNDEIIYLKFLKYKEANFNNLRISHGLLGA